MQNFIRENRWFLIVSLSFLLIVFILCLQISKSESIDDYFGIARQYQLAYNNSDFSLLDSFAISPKEYSDLITKIDIEYPDCLTDFDKTFDVNIFKRNFQKSHLYKLKTDSIVINKVSDYNTCSKLDIKKVLCLVYFKKQNKSIPVNLIVINLNKNQPKILLDIINENYFTNEKL